MLTKDAEQVFPAPNFKVYGKESDVSIINSYNMLFANLIVIGGLLSEEPRG
jgi:hypothetical protein